jgi:hypothetical protein
MQGKTLTITDENEYFTHQVVFPQGETVMVVTLEYMCEWEVSFVNGGNTVRLTATVDRVGGVYLDMIPLITWSNGSDAAIVGMVQREDAGEIDLSDYWHVGDTRTVHLSAMGTSTGIDETHVAQDVELVLMDTNHFTLNTPTASGRTTCSFVIGMKDSLIEKGKINTSQTNVGGWDQSPRRNWCNTVFKNAIPATLLPIFKQFKVKASAGNKSTSLVESVDWFSLPCMSEVGLTFSYAVAGEGTTMQWYNTSSNRIKKLSSSGSANIWWTRSPSTGDTYSFCNVDMNGTAFTNTAFNGYGLSPFGVI